MRTFIHSVVVQNEAIVVGTGPSYAVPTQPLSFLLLTLRFAQNQANTQLAFANIAGMMTKVEVLYKGQAILSMSGVDLLALNVGVLGFQSWTVNNCGEDNDLRSFTFLLPFGRTPYSQVECFPKTQRGELMLQITYAAAFTQIDGGSLQVEAVELPEASPSQFLKATTLVATPAATGQFDIDLPMGNVISDLMVFGTTIPALAVATRTITDLQIRKNNVESFFSKTNFETLHNMAGIWQPAPGYHGLHTHQLDGAGYAQYMETSALKPQNHILANYLRVCFDPWGMGEYGLDTSDAKSLQMRVTAGDVNAIRVVPVELVKV